MSRPTFRLLVYDSSLVHPSLPNARAIVRHGEVSSRSMVARQKIGPNDVVVEMAGQSGLHLFDVVTGQTIAKPLAALTLDDVSPGVGQVVNVTLGQDAVLRVFNTGLSQEVSRTALTAGAHTLTFAAAGSYIVTAEAIPHFISTTIKVEVA